MPSEQVTIRTRDGDCVTHVMRPAAGDRWPAVIFYMDAGGIRPALLAMAQQLADAGYIVLLRTCSTDTARTGLSYRRKCSQATSARSSGR